MGNGMSPGQPDSAYLRLLPAERVDTKGAHLMAICTLQFKDSGQAFRHSEGIGADVKVHFDAGSTASTVSRNKPPVSELQSAPESVGGGSEDSGSHSSCVILAKLTSLSWQMTSQEAESAETTSTQSNRLASLKVCL